MEQNKEREAFAKFVTKRDSLTESEIDRVIYCNGTAWMVWQARANHSVAAAEMVASQSAEPVALMPSIAACIRGAEASGGAIDGRTAAKVFAAMVAADSVPTRAAATGAQGMTDADIEPWRHARFGAFHEGKFVELGPDDIEHPAAAHARWVGGARDYELLSHVLASTDEAPECVASASNLHWLIGEAIRLASDKFPPGMVAELEDARAILAQSAPAATAPSDGARQAEKSLAAIDKALRGRVNDPDPLTKLLAHTAAGEPTTYGLVAGLLRERDALLAKVGKFDQRIVDLGVLAMETAAPAPSASPAAPTGDEAGAIRQVYYTDCGGVWVDASQETYDAHPAATRRIVYAAQPPAAAEADKLRNALQMARAAMIDNGLTKHGLPRVFEIIDAAMGKEGM